ncbi:uncharacterized protein LOC108454976 [Gossypium arboreum]|uniref:uncharacterized protein LOC108454976 n=1 Tax=Gossypium arboreum TaxID=29729 RepID=UPI0008195240|nr:uncharacterized protein LOC108454976 [Gossypium arboreum]
MTFLGHAVFVEGICVDLKKIEVALDWKQPKNVSKIYLKRHDIEYSVGDFVFLKVPPWKKLELPPEMERIHNVFHVSMLRQYWFDPSHVVSIMKIEVRPYLTFEKESVQILDRDVKVLRRKSIPLVKVLWQNHGTEEAT